MNEKLGRPPSWEEEDLANALYHYFNTEHGLDITSRKFGVPKTTLYRYVQKEKERRSESSERSSESSERSSESSERSSESLERSLERSSEQSKGRVKANPGKSLGQMHAYQAERYRGQTYLKIAVGFLIGLFVQELVSGRTGDTLFGWLVGQPKPRQPEVQTVAPSSQESYFQAQPQPQLKGYDLSDFK